MKCIWIYVLIFIECSTCSSCRACFLPSLRVSRPPDSHQHVPAKASGEWLVQPASREAETENNWDCAALPQQATGARVLHFTLPRGRGGKASPLMQICPVLTLAHKCTLQHTHTPSCNHAPFTTVRCIHTQNFYIYTVLFCYLYDYIYQHCLPLTPKAKCQKSCQDGKKLHFYFAAANWMAKVLQWFFPYLGSWFVTKENVNFLLFLECSTIVSHLAFLKMSKVSLQNPCKSHQGIVIQRSIQNPYLHICYFYFFDDFFFFFFAKQLSI